MMVSHTQELIESRSPSAVTAAGTGTAKHKSRVGDDAGDTNLTRATAQRLLTHQLTSLALP